MNDAAACLTTLVQYKQVAGVSACAPVRRDRDTVYRTAKFPFYNIINHGFAETFNPVMQAAQLGILR